MDHLRGVSVLNSCHTFIGSLLLLLGTVGCSSTAKLVGLEPSGVAALAPVKMTAPVDLRLKAQPKAIEAVDYYHISASRAFEGAELRHDKTDVMSFTAEAETIDVKPDRFTQVIQVKKKDGKLGLHDFAMPEPGEKLEVVSTNMGKVLRAGDWPTNSIFYVSPVSLPDGPVEPGDTWAMQSSWLSLEDMVPYQLDMVSILKGFVRCGDDTCADIELNGGVSMQGELGSQVVFRSEWRGRMLFALTEGTVIWSRINSEELFAHERVYRKVGSCLEAGLRAPKTISIFPADRGPQCSGFVPPTATR